jgi:putative phosphoesterase
VLIGLISDTHIPEAGPVLWPQAYDRLRGVELILHGGDIHSLEVIDLLEEIAPIYVARGNGDDGGAGRPIVPEDPRLKEEWPPHRTIHTVVDHYFGGPQHIVVYGDTHVASVETLRGILLVNPGSPMYPRNLDTRLGTIGFLELHNGRARAWLEQLDEEGSHVVAEQPRYV